MVPNRSRGPIVAVAIAVVLASLLAPGVLAQQAQQTEQPESEPNDNPRNATFIQPGATITGEITPSENATNADADWFAVPVKQGQNVSVAFESGSESERLLVFLASPSASASGNVSAVNDTLADATIAPSGSTVQLNATANGSRLYFIGVTGRSGEYQFTAETTGNGTMMANGTNVTMPNGTNMTMANGTDMANATTSTQATSTTSTPTTTETTEATTTTETTASSGGSGGDGGGGEETSTTGPGFGLLAALVAVLAAALLAKRRR